MNISLTEAEYLVLHRGTPYGGLTYGGDKGSRILFLPSASGLIDVTRVLCTARLLADIDHDAIDSLLEKLEDRFGSPFDETAPAWECAGRTRTHIEPNESGKMKHGQAHLVIETRNTEAAHAIAEWFTALMQEHGVDADEGIAGVLETNADLWKETGNVYPQES